MSAEQKPATHFRDLAFILMPVKDMARARAFYEDVLGLKVTAQWENQWVEYDIGAGTLALAVEADILRAGNQGARLGIEVDDMDATLKLLAENEIKPIRDPWDTPSCRGCFIADPDGNEIMLHWKKPEP